MTISYGPKIRLESWPFDDDDDDDADEDDDDAAYGNDDNDAADDSTEIEDAPARDGDVLGPPPWRKQRVITVD